MVIYKQIFNIFYNFPRVKNRIINSWISKVKRYGRENKDFIQRKNCMLSQIQTLLTNNSSSCITHANKLAFTNRQRTIHGEDLFWGISLFLKHHDLNTIFWKLLGVSEELLEEYFQNKYDVPTIVGSLEEAKKLPLSKKIAQEFNKHINETTKKLDLDILFFVSFHDLSNQFTDHLYTHNINPESIVENYKKLSKNPIITKMWVFAFLQILSKIFVTFNLDVNKIKLMEIEKMQKMNNINMLLDAVESEIVEKENTVVTGEKNKKEEEETHDRILRHRSDKRSQRRAYRSNHRKTEWDQSDHLYAFEKEQK